MNKEMFSATAPNLFQKLSRGPDAEEAMVRQANRARTGQRRSSMPSVAAGMGAGSSMNFPMKEGDYMDAEDLRFHAIRRAVMDRSSKKKLDTFSRAQSEIGSVSNAMKHVVQELMKEDEHLLESTEQLARIIDDFSKELDDSMAIPYLAWACNQLGVETSYPQYESRAQAGRMRSAEEEELSLDQMIEECSPSHRRATALPNPLLGPTSGTTATDPDVDAEAGAAAGPA